MSYGTTRVMAYAVNGPETNPSSGNTTHDIAGFVISWTDAGISGQGWTSQELQIGGQEGPQINYQPSDAIGSNEFRKKVDDALEEMDPLSRSHWLGAFGQSYSGCVSASGS